MLKKICSIKTIHTIASNNSTLNLHHLFLSKKLAAYLHPINDKRLGGQVGTKSGGVISLKGTRFNSGSSTPIVHVPMKSSLPNSQRSVTAIPSNSNFICLFHLLDFFKIKSSAGNPLGPCNKRTSCKLEHPQAGPVGRANKYFWIKSVTDSGLFYAKNQVISKQVISAINACP